MVRNQRKRSGDDLEKEARGKGRLWWNADKEWGGSSFCLKSYNKKYCLFATKLGELSWNVSAGSMASGFSLVYQVQVWQLPAQTRGHQRQGDETQEREVLWQSKQGQVGPAVHSLWSKIQENQLRQELSAWHELYKTRLQGGQLWGKGCFVNVESRQFPCLVGCEGWPCKGHCCRVVIVLVPSLSVGMAAGLVCTSLISIPICFVGKTAGRKVHSHIAFFFFFFPSWKHLESDASTSTEMCWIWEGGSSIMAHSTQCNTLGMKMLLPHVSFIKDPLTRIPELVMEKPLSTKAPPKLAYLRVLGSFWAQA